jgi:hypothetical protein
MGWSLSKGAEGENPEKEKDDVSDMTLLTFRVSLCSIQQQVPNNGRGILEASSRRSSSKDIIRDGIELQGKECAIWPQL